MVIDNLAETLRKRAFEALLAVTPGEAQAWEKHPCTRALLLQLQGAYVDKYVQWGSGSFTHESKDGTNQKNAQALGVCEGLEQAEAFIQDMSESLNDAKEEFKDDRT